MFLPAGTRIVFREVTIPNQPKKEIPMELKAARRAKPKLKTPTHFRFACKVKGKNGAQKEIVVENSDAHAGLLEFARDVASAGMVGAVAVEAKMTIFATREFISTFKPREG